MSVSRNNLLAWLDDRELQPITLLAWAGEYEDRGTILTRDVARVREICAAVVMPWLSYEKVSFPYGINGLRIWTTDKVVHVANSDDGFSFEVLDRNPPDEPDREWGPRP